MHNYYCLRELRTAFLLDLYAITFWDIVNRILLQQLMNLLYWLLFSCLPLLGKQYKAK